MLNFFTQMITGSMERAHDEEEVKKPNIKSDIYLLNQALIAAI